MAGAEKLIYELAYFAGQNNTKVTVLIVNNYNTEYYDAVFKEMGIKVVRTTLLGTKKLRNPVNINRAIYWQQRLKRFANKYYKSVHIIGLYNLDKTIHGIKHKNRFFWHVNNAIQYPQSIYPFNPAHFADPNDTVLCINPYQLTELNEQYGDAIKCKIEVFKLFLASV